MWPRRAVSPLHLVKRWHSGHHSHATAADATPTGSGRRSHREVREQVAATALFIARHTIEAMVAEGRNADKSRAAQSVQSIQASLEMTSLGRRLSAQQTTLMQMEPGSWPDEALNRYSAMWETQGILLWAMRRVSEVPAFSSGKRFDRQMVFTAGGVTPNPVSIESFVNSDRVRLTIQDDIEQMRNCAEAWHWRARAYAVQQAAQRVLSESTKGDRLPPGLRSYLKNIDGAVRQAAIRANADGLIEYTADDDFAVNELAYRDVTVEAWHTLEMIAYGRLMGLGWIMGTYDWDVSPEDLTTYASPMAAMFAPPPSD